MTGHPTPPFEPTEIVTFKTTPQGELKLHIFAPPAADSPRPTIVFFFGGGWANGTPTQFYPHSAYLASRGMVAMAAEYRIKNTHGTTPFECVADGKSAVRWIRQHAAQYQIDSERVAAGGGSAGGHVAAATGFCAGLDEAGEDTSVSSKPDALVLFNPVFDNGPNGFGYEAVKPRWQTISPLHNVAAGAPPTWVCFGKDDKLLPGTNLADFVRRMNEAGSRHEVLLYEGQPHGFFNYREGENPHYFATLNAADVFLAAHGFLAGEPTFAAPSAPVEML